MVNNIKKVKKNIAYFYAIPVSRKRNKIHFHEIHLETQIKFEKIVKIT